MRLRHKLVILFLAATLLPLAAVLWLSSALMSRSLTFVDTSDAASLAASLERVGREYYRQARERLKDEATSGRIEPERLDEASMERWPAPLQHFWQGADVERFILAEPAGDSLQYAVKRDGYLLVYSADLEGIRLGELSRQIRDARIRAGERKGRDLPRGFTLALLIAAGLVWMMSLAVVVYMSVRITRPIGRLTTGLGALAAGRFETRLESPASRDEVGAAIEAFNVTAGELQRSRERLVYLTQVASWQLLARKMAHELKNSLTPIRLTVEEIAARRTSADPEFFDRAVAIVVDEVGSLERRVRAFSEFAAEPQVRPSHLVLEAIVRERVAFLRAAHPGVTYTVEHLGDGCTAWADGDQVRGILTNLLENAAEAAGEDGAVLVLTIQGDAHVAVEVHDTGPGVTPDARSRLFEPSISFKKQGMGLGLAISRKNALLAGGDLALVESKLGGAGFRLVLPAGTDPERKGRVDGDGPDGSRVKGQPDGGVEAPTADEDER